jgi:hypothetical protein
VPGGQEQGKLQGLLVRVRGSVLGGGEEHREHQNHCQVFFWVESRASCEGQCQARFQACWRRVRNTESMGSFMGLRSRIQRSWEDITRPALQVQCTSHPLWVCGRWETDAQGQLSPRAQSLGCPQGSVPRADFCPLHSSQLCWSRVELSPAGMCVTQRGLFALTGVQGWGRASGLDGSLCPVFF